MRTGIFTQHRKLGRGLIDGERARQYQINSTLWWLLGAVSEDIRQATQPFVELRGDAEVVYHKPYSVQWFPVQVDELPDGGVLLTATALVTLVRASDAEIGGFLAGHAYRTQEKTFRLSPANSKHGGELWEFTKEVYAVHLKDGDRGTRDNPLIDIEYFTAWRRTS